MDIIKKLVDLYEQAITEQSHYYTASTIKEAIGEILELKEKLRNYESISEYLIFGKNRKT